MHRHKRELRLGSRAEIDFRPGMRGKLMVAGYEVGMAVRLNNVFDGEAVRLGFFKVDIDIPLRIDDRGFGPGSDQVGSVRETSQIKLSEIHPEDFNIPFPLGDRTPLLVRRGVRLRRLILYTTESSVCSATA